MPSRLTLAAGVLGVGSLAFVGVGGYAAFTSNVNLNTSATAGSFILNATPGTTGESCAQNSGGFGGFCAPQDAVNSSTNIGSLSDFSNSTSITPEGTNASATWTVPNMAPGDMYYADVILTDVGTLQGEVSAVTYTPPSESSGSPAANLLSDMTVTVQEKTPQGAWDTLPLQAIDYGGNGTGNLPAGKSYVFGTAVSGGNVPFLQPAKANPDYEASAEFRVIYTLLGSAGNGVSGVTITGGPTISFEGTSLP